MSRCKLLTTRFFPQRPRQPANPLQQLSDDPKPSNTLLCKDCLRFLRGSPQTWTERDLRDFVAMANHEHMLMKLDDSKQAQRILNRAHFYDLDNMFEHSRNRTCHFCAVIREAFLDNKPISREFVELEEDCAAGRSAELVLRITLRTHTNVGRFPHCLAVDLALPHQKLLLCVNIYLIPSTEADLTFTGQPMDNSTSSGTSFALAKSWLSTCLRDHSGCSVQTVHNNTLPARLLDIEKVSLTGKVSLHTTSSCHGQYQYLTLSHCWGKSQHLTLTQGNLPDLIAGVPVNGLALTFQHAIEITRQLGYRYLWIDSLCIIQDSANDWNIEASKMASIYGGSVCCIAASASRDSEEGCFRDRNPWAIQPLKIEHNLFPELPAFNYSGPTLVAADDILGPFYSDSLSNRPLDTRGWTLQESVLAPRTLGYCRLETSWECRNITASEIWPAGTPSDIWNPALDGYSKSVFDISKLLPVESKTGGRISDERILYRRWEKLVQLYNRRSLTRREDKFPALGGMADIMMSITGDKYCAGLWLHDFRRGLTWSNDDIIPQTRPDEWVAPTWSWASVQTTTTYDDVTEYAVDMECEVEAVHVEHLGGTPSGRVESGKAILIGMMRCINWTWIPGTTRARRLIDGVWTTRLNDITEVIMDIDLAEDPAENLDPIYLFQLYRSTSASPFYRHDIRCMYALILEPIELSENEFYRVGIMKTRRAQELTSEDWRYFTQGWARMRITVF